MHEAAKGLIALIPARQGSKRLPGKNLRPLGGIPLIVHSIRQALEARLVEQVYVSTDCPHIAQVSREAGALVPALRPAELASDEATSLAVFQHFLAHQPCRHLLVLQPTSPLRQPEDIDQAIRLFLDRQADSVISCTAVAPKNWFSKVQPQGNLSKAFTDEGGEVLYLPNGSIYLFRSELLLSGQDYYTPSTYAYIMPRSRSIDIDTPDDFLMAEALWKLPSHTG